jgi:hypothetical protein
MRSGLRLPDDYFDDFQQRLDKRMDEDIRAPQNNELKVTSGYKVPTDYFDKLHIDIDEKCSFNTKKQWLAMAAILVVMLSVGILTQPFSSETGNMKISDIEEKQLEQYIKYQYMNEEVLKSYAKEQDMQFELNKALRTIDKKEILTYFDDQLNDLYAYED